MKNVCITGWGAIAPLHADALLKTNNVRFYAVCDTDEKKLHNCVEEFRVICYTSFDEMLMDEQIDAVHICTPHYLHYEMIIKALRAGKKVVCEKPVVMTMDELLRLEEEQNADNVCVLFQTRLNSCVINLKNIVNSGKLGKITGLKGMVTWYRDNEYYKSAEWRGKMSTEGGGVLINQAIHTLDLMVYLGGNIKSVEGNVYNYSLKNEIEVEDTVSARLKFQDGAVGILFATNAYVKNDSPEIEIVFEKGVANYAGGKLFINGEMIAEDERTNIGKDYWGSGHLGVVKRFYETGEGVRIRDVSNTMKALFSIYKSSKEGKEMFV